MTTTYKKLTSYLLERDDTQTTGLSGYYYGGTGEVTDNSPFNNRFNSIKLDTSFSLELNSGAGCLAEQEDGKILIGGSFTLVNGVTRNRIARLNTDGTLDSSFNPNTNDTINAMSIQSDGKILIGGNFTTVGGTARNRIARLNSDGTLDTGFNPNVNSYIYDIILQSDGKILINGNFTTVGGTARNRIARLNTDGTLDTGFNPNVNDTINAMSIQSDGKILIGGNFTTVGGTARNRIARLNSDGTLDVGFDPNADNYVTSIVLQSDEKIVITGGFNTVSGVSKQYLARLNSDGTLDNSFVNLSYVSTNSYLADLTMQDDDKIIVGFGYNIQTVNGVFEYGCIRINADGSLDTSFNSNVKDGSGNPVQVAKTYKLSNGKIVFMTSALNPVVDGQTLESNTFIVKEVVNQAPYRLAYTVPLATNTVVKNIFAANQNDFPVFYDIAILPSTNSSEEISERHHYVWDDLIEENDYHEVDCNITLSAGDEIYVYSSTDENISFNIFGIEYTQ